MCDFFFFHSSPEIILFIFFFPRSKFSDGAFSIGIGLELAGVAEPVCRAGLIYNLHRKGGLAGECRPPLRCLSQFLSHERERDQLLMVL